MWSPDACLPAPKAGELCHVNDVDGGPGGEEILCGDGLYCGKDGVCHEKARYGGRCASTPCADGLRCVDGWVDGACG